MLLPPVFETLKANPAIPALLGTDPLRIWRLSVPETLRKPLTEDYLTWFLLTSVPINNLSDPPPADRQTVQIDCWSPEGPRNDGDKRVVTLATLVRDTLEPTVHMTAINIHDREIETRLWRISLQFDWWGR